MKAANSLLYLALWAKCQYVFDVHVFGFKKYREGAAVVVRVVWRPWYVLYDGRRTYCMAAAVQ